MDQQKPNEQIPDEKESKMAAMQRFLEIINAINKQNEVMLKQQIDLINMLKYGK